jgi:hypothetical protein
LLRSNRESYNTNTTWLSCDASAEACTHILEYRDRKLASLDQTLLERDLRSLRSGKANFEQKAELERLESRREPQQHAIAVRDERSTALVLSWSWRIDSTLARLARHEARRLVRGDESVLGPQIQRFERFSLPPLTVSLGVATENGISRLSYVGTQYVGTRITTSGKSSLASA